MGQTHKRQVGLEINLARAQTLVFIAVQNHYNTAGKTTTNTPDYNDAHIHVLSNRVQL